MTFKFKTECGLELLKPETMKVIGSTENKIAKDKNGENIPHLEITEVVLIHCNIVNMIINEIQKFCIHLFEINYLAVF